ncbi:hypothetical protein [Natronorubrum sp. FCH18a]|uniref:hypothetical protein n=1 Tax=Natronorubrum sp. FCH18a TaxID=3447018 RepID=UPI003F51385D
MPPECSLCQQEKELVDSHIIPNFVIRWIKKSGATSFLRTAENPETRIQDYKEPMLCNDCEQILSDWEGEFAGAIFYPFLRDQKEEFEYSKWLQKFIISVSWRILEADRTPLDEFDESTKTVIRQTKEEWGKLILGDSSLSDEDRDHHLLFLGDIETPAEGLPEKWEFYSDRGIDATIAESEGDMHVYFKFPQMVFVSCISPTSIDGFNGTKVSDEGKISVPQELVNPEWGSFIFGRSELVTNDLSDREIEKSLTGYQKILRKFLNLKAFKRIKKSVREKLSHTSLRIILTKNVQYVG